MDSLAINIFDLGVILTIVLGALAGLALGFVKGGLFVLSWIGAIFATVAWFPLVRPYGRQFIETPWIADVSAGGALFLVTLTALFLISSLIGSWVRGSRLNALDRSLGMLAGLATAALVVSTIYIVLTSMWTEKERPEWLITARSLPLVEAGAGALRSLLPLGSEEADGDSENRRRKSLETERMFGDMNAPAPKGKRPDGPAGYGQRERKDMER
ncbi:MAG: CvpA family protein, partial [Alphaproteobacteria bacterium]